MKPYLEKCVGRFLLSGEVSPSVFSSEKTDWGAAGEMGMGGSSHFLAAATQSSLAPLQSCLVEDSIVLLNIVFLLQQKRTMSPMAFLGLKLIGLPVPSACGWMKKSSREAAVYIKPLVQSSKSDTILTPLYLAI